MNDRDDEQDRIDEPGNMLIDTFRSDFNLFEDEHAPGECATCDAKRRQDDDDGSR